MLRTPALLFALIALVPPAAAEDFAVKDLRVLHPVARPTPPGARTGAVYFEVRNDGRSADRLLRVASPVGAAAELHTMSHEGTMMKMRAVASLDIPAGGALTLAPGGNHVMLLDIRQPLRAGETVPLMLTFERAGTVEITARVEPIKEAGHMP